MESDPRLSRAAQGVRLDDAGPAPEVQPPCAQDDRWSGRAIGALLALLAGAFVIALDFFLTLVTLPSIQRSLGSSDAELQLMVAAYATAFAAGLVAAGRLGDIYGSRRIYQLGLLLFALASLGAFAAPSSVLMIVARATQGLAGALMQPQIIAILALHFGGRSRGRAFAAYALSQALAGVTGQLTAGVIIDWNVGGWGWRACFLAVVPVVLLAMLLTQACVDDRSAARPPRVDWIGMLLGSAALVSLIWTLTVGMSRLPWPAFVTGLGASAVLALCFAVQQRRLARASGHPTLPVHLLRRRSVQLGLYCVFLFYLGLMSFYWLFSVRTQQELGLGAAEAGKLFAVYGVTFMIATVCSPQLTRRWGRAALPRGAWLLACGHVSAIIVTQAGAPLPWMGGALAVTGLGMGLVMAPLLSAVTANASAEDAGALAGTVGTVQSAANALGTAIVPVAYLSREAASPSGFFLGGYSTSLLALAVLATAVALLSHRALER